MQGSASSVFINDYVNVNFEDTPDTYRPGMMFKGKVTTSLRSLALLPIIERLLQMCFK